MGNWPPSWIELTGGDEFSSRAAFAGLTGITAECINPAMANTRAPNQTMIAFALKQDLLEAIDDTAARIGASRSTFIRQALAAKIRDCDQPVEEHWIPTQVRGPIGSGFVPRQPAAKPPVPPAAPAARRKVPVRAPSRKPRPT